MSEPNNILPFDSGNSGMQKLSEDKLMQYLEGKLTTAEQHMVEQWLADEGMEGDAMEGLRTIHPDETRHAINKLNHKLQKTLHRNKRKHKPLKTDQFTLI